MTIPRTCVLALLLVMVSGPAAAQPGTATLGAPSADVVGTTIAFTWQSVPTATWYQLWLGRANTTLVLEQWYTAEHAGCAGGGTCAVTLTPPISAGAFIWHIRAWSPSGYGPWSATHLFTARDPTPAWSSTLPASRRFTVVLNGEGVIDNETGLVWQRTPSLNQMQWTLTQATCLHLVAGGRRGWRVPTIAELASLVDPTRTNPSLPAGHPFVLPDMPGQYWSQTISLTSSDSAWQVNFTNGSSLFEIYGFNRKLWCVRGGAAAQ